jgi:hypothetical protein
VRIANRALIGARENKCLRYSSMSLVHMFDPQVSSPIDICFIPIAVTTPLKNVIGQEDGNEKEKYQHLLGM